MTTTPNPFRDAVRGLVEYAALWLEQEESIHRDERTRIMKKRIAAVKSHLPEEATAVDEQGASEAADTAETPWISPALRRAKRIEEAAARFVDAYSRLGMGGTAKHRLEALKAALESP